jgi:hypothetical protein
MGDDANESKLEPNYHQVVRGERNILTCYEY